MDAVPPAILWPLAVIVWLLVLMLMLSVDGSDLAVKSHETEGGLRTLLLKLFLNWDSDLPITLEDISCYLNLVAPKAPIIAVRGLNCWFPVEIYWTRGTSSALLDRLKIDLAEVNPEC